MSLKEELHLRRPFSSIQEEALLSVFTTWDLLYRNVQKVMRSHGISLAQYNVLRILRGAGPEGIPLMEIARRVIVRYPNVTRLTDRLEADGLMKRERSTQDRRVVRALATHAGLDLLTKLDGEVALLNIHLMRGANESDLQRMIEILASVRQPLRDEEQAEFPNGNGHAVSNGGDPEI
jgi:DNA-binding MarR family transcriptional regulator